MAKASGALTVAIVNDVDSPLAGACDIVLPMAAGPELSVAATKSFVAALAMLLRVTAAWSNDDALGAAIERLPDRLQAATDLDWSSALETLANATNLTTIGRGPTLAIAREAALKLKETCNLQAEPFSSAEFQHGPMALVSPLYPILVFMPTDAAAASVKDSRRRSARQGRGDFVGGIWRGQSGPPAGISARSCRYRRGVPDPKLLCPCHPRGGAARHRCGPAPSPAKGDTHAMSSPKQHAVAGRQVFDGSVVQHNAAVVMEGARIIARGAARRPAGGDADARSAGWFLACARIYRSAGERRRRRAVQR